jgi:ribosomal protein S17E
MGRIKSLMVKKAARQLLDEAAFDTTFENNKKVLRNTMPSKPIRNKIAGYISRLMKMRAQKLADAKKPVVAVVAEQSVQ